MALTWQMLHLYPVGMEAASELLRLGSEGSSQLQRTPSLLDAENQGFVRHSGGNNTYAAVIPSASVTAAATPYII